MINAKKIHIVGANGIGISALAKILENLGASMSRSDIETGGHRAENVPSDAELLIYSNAVPENNAERVRARETGIREMSYPEALGQFCLGKKIIAVSGTNGKTTTTAMLGWILEQAGLDPTVIVGSRVLAWNSNARTGKGELVVIEADEYKRAFLNYNPDIAVITNIAADHLDYYKDLDDIKTAFFQFTQKIKPGGVLLFNVDDENAAWVADKFSGESVGFAGSGSFGLHAPGQFNQANASAASAAASVLGVPFEQVRSALQSFGGTWRRFERVGTFKGAEIISDYAHHPAAVRGTLAAAAEKYSNNILAVFQPHQHNRTKMLFREFVQAFCDSPVNDIIVSEIFDVAGREDSRDQDISSRDLTEEIKKSGKNSVYAKDLTECESMIREKAGKYQAIIIMGAGDIYKVADKLIANNS